MDFDFRHRCVVIVPGTEHMPEHQLIFYGLTARDVVGLRPAVFDIGSPYAELSVGGRTSATEERSQHFFTRHLGRDYHATEAKTETTGPRRQAVLGHYHDSHFGAFDGGGSADGT